MTGAPGQSPQAAEIRELTMSQVAILTSDDQNRADDNRASGHGIVLSGDRTREFRRARWHSVMIRTLRIATPLASVGLVALYVTTMLQTAGYGVKVAAPTIAPTLGKEIAMDNPRYEGFSKDGGSYVMSAKTAIPDLSNPSMVKLNQITGEVYDARKSRTDVTATHGLFDSKANKLDLTDGISVVTQTGMRATLQTATMMTKEGTLQSNTPVVVEMPSAKVTANQLSLNQKTHDATFLGNVVTHLVAPAKPADPAAPAVPVPAARETAFGHSNAPIDVTSDRLDVHDSQKAAKFSGHVRANQGAAQIETAVLDVTYEGGANPAAATPADPAQPAAPATKIKRIVAPGPVVLLQGTGDRVTGNSADFDATGESAVVTGSVTMTSGADRRATADRAEFQQKSDTILLSGNVVVNAGRNEMRGRRLFVDRKTGKTDLSSPADGTLGKSRIFTRLYQGDGQPAKAPAAKKDAVADEAAAAAGPAGIMSFKTDPSAPVDIEADKLNVDDGKKLAIFTGDVKAAQGDFVIRTIELHAAYSGDAGLASPSITPGAAPATKSPAQLTKIEAKGKVVVTSKASQQVTGDWATFDTKANTVVIGGKEVIINQDKNIIQCSKVLIDTASGLSKCITETAGVSGGPSVKGKGGRASIVFYPQERPKGGIAPPKPSVPVKPAASSWESAVEPSKKP
jgi:hypothetical protein